jgi:hypothetical protein
MGVNDMAIMMYILTGLGIGALALVIGTLVHVIQTVRRQEQLYADKQRDRLLYRAAYYAEEWQRKQLKELKNVVASAQKLAAACEYLEKRYTDRGIPVPPRVELEQDVESILPIVRSGARNDYEDDE